MIAPSPIVTSAPGYEAAATSLDPSPLVTGIWATLWLHGQFHGERNQFHRSLFA